MHSIDQARDENLVALEILERGKFQMSSLGIVMQQHYSDSLKHALPQRAVLYEYLCQGAFERGG